MPSITDTHIRRFTDFFLIVVGLAVLLLFTQHVITGDGSARFDFVTRIMNDHVISPLSYSVLMPLCSIPFYILGTFLKTPQWWCARFNFFVFTIFLVFIYRELSSMTSRRTARIFIIILSFASMFPAHLMNYYGEVFTVLCAGLGICRIANGKHFSGWSLLVAAVVNTPAAIIGLALIALYFCVSEKRFRYLLPLLCAIIIIMTEFWVKNGSPFTSGYESHHGLKTFMPYSGKPGFSYPFFFGVLSILFSFGKGIFFFAPGLLLPLGKNKFPSMNQKILLAHRLMLLFLAGLVIVYASWWAWYGGWFWGPRFFLFASLPASLSLALYMEKKSRSTFLSMVLFVFLAFSFWIGMNGTVFNQAHLQICTARNYFLESVCWYMPEFSVLFRPFVVTKSLLWQDMMVIGFTIVVFLYLTFSLFKEMCIRAENSARLLMDRHILHGSWKF